MEKDAIEDFLSHYPSQKTQKAYRSQLKNYFEIIDADPKEYLDNGRDYKKDIEQFWNIYSSHPPKTRVLALSAIKMMLEENDIEFPRKFWRKLTRRAKGRHAVTRDKVPTSEELKIILQHSKIQGKALFLMLATSGIRINEALQLTPDDIELDKVPVRIYVPAQVSKSGEKRITFITNEARDALKEYLKIRTKYLRSMVKKTKNRKDKDDRRIFPFCYQNAWDMWKNSINSAEFSGRDKTTNRFQFHIHGLRKFFRSRLAKAIGVDMTEFLMGHEGYLTREYRDYPDEELAKEYMKGAERLLIFETPADTSDIRESLAQKDKEMQEMRTEMQEMKMKLLELYVEKHEKQINGK